MTNPTKRRLRAVPWLLLAGAALLLGAARPWSTRSGNAPMASTAPSASGSAAPVVGAVAVPMPRWASPSSSAAATPPSGASAEITLDNGVRAVLRATRSRVPLGADPGIELFMFDPSGKPLDRPLAGAELLVASGDGAPVDAPLVNFPSARGQWTSTFSHKLEGHGHVRATTVVQQLSNGQVVGQPKAMTVAIEVGEDASLVGGPVAVWLPTGLTVKVPVRTGRDFACTVRAALVDAKGEPLGIATGEALIQAGVPGEIVLDFSAAMPSPGHPSAVGLALKDTTLFVPDAAGKPDWVDFWSTERPLVQAAGTP